MNIANSLEPLLNVLIGNELVSILERWLGKKILGRGLDYAEKKRVRDIIVTDDGRIVATVVGNVEYITSIWLKKSGELDGVCTCPYFGPCKHMAAAALSSQETLRKKKMLPVQEKWDFRPIIISALDPMTSQQSLKKLMGTLSKKDLVELLLNACDLDVKARMFCALIVQMDKLSCQSLKSPVKNIILDAEYGSNSEEDATNLDYGYIAKKLCKLISDSETHADTEKFSMDSGFASATNIELSEDEGWEE